MENSYTEIISVISIMIVLLVSIVIVFIQILPGSHENTINYEIKAAKEQKTVTADFLLSYILPLFAFNFTEWSGVALFLLFFIIFWFLVARHNVFSANILLEIMKYRFYECELVTMDDTEVEMTILSRRHLISMKAENIYIRSLNNELKLDVDKK